MRRLTLLLTCCLVIVSAARADRVVYVAGGLSDEAIVTLTAAVAARDPGAIVLFDGAPSAAHTRAFLAAYKPQRVVPVGSFADDGLERRLGVPVAPVIAWKGGPPAALWRMLFPKAERVVVCPPESRGLFLQAACLAGASGAPLFVTRGEPGEAAELRRWLAGWETHEVYAVGGAAKLCRELDQCRVTELSGEPAVAAEHLRWLRRNGPIDTLVLTNPFDTGKELGGMSRLAPWVALQHRAALLLTDESGENAAAVVRVALTNPELRRADALILVANLKAIPQERRPNPAEGKDVFIEMEPLTPKSTGEPFSLALGRLFHADLNVIALVLARQRLLAEARPLRKALVASNPGGGLPLLEVFSRHTAKELRSRGYETTALFEDDLTPEKLRKALPQQDIFLWEGHHKTLVEEFGVPGWTEPLRPALVVLQSCLALNEAEAHPLLERGAVALVGSSSRTYSGSGGAFTLCYFNALLYDEQSLGGALRQAKNFLYAYARLKERRLGEDAKLKGANLRSAWAFSLWGDPALKLPPPAVPANAPAAVRHQVKGNSIVLTVPEKRYDKEASEKFRAQTWPNARLAGLVRVDAADEELRQLVSLLFAEVRLPRGPVGKAPTLHSRLAARNWVFTWDERREVGYLLVVAPRDRNEVRFTVTWDE